MRSASRGDQIEAIDHRDGPTVERLDRGTPLDDFRASHRVFDPGIVREQCREPFAIVAGWHKRSMYAGSAVRICWLVTMGCLAVAIVSACIVITAASPTAIKVATCIGLILFTP